MAAYCYTMKQQQQQRVQRPVDSDRRRPVVIVSARRQLTAVLWLIDDVNANEVTGGTSRATVDRQRRCLAMWKTTRFPSIETAFYEFVIVRMDRCVWKVSKESNYTERKNLLWTICNRPIGYLTVSTSHCQPVEIWDNLGYELRRQPDTPLNNGLQINLPLKLGFLFGRRSDDVMYEKSLVVTDVDGSRLDYSCATVVW